ncbi:hypothetical protein GLOIN_2v1506309, partial [Rhizophagus irregularis DAOM 181602=DAOM 197198]
FYYFMYYEISLRILFIKHKSNIVMPLRDRITFMDNSMLIPATLNGLYFMCNNFFYIFIYDINWHYDVLLAKIKI